MNPKEKAIDLYGYYYELVADTPDPEWRAKDAAMTTVTEIIWAMGGPIKSDKYWEEVLEEIKKTMTKYRIVEEKYPSYSLWIPELDRGNGWIPFTKVGRPYDRLVLSSKSEAEFHIKQEKHREEFENESPEIIYHEI